MRDFLSVLCLVFAMGYCYVVASTAPDIPDAQLPSVVVDSDDTGSPAGTAFSSSEQFVYRVRQQSGYGTTGGSAVSLGNGLLVTAAHVLQSNAQPQVNVNGRWVPAGFNRVAGQDVAYLTINDTSLPGAPVRRPVNGEHVSIYGMTTRHPWSGNITAGPDKKGMWQVNLNTDLEGTESGDSGAGVFGDDGSLLLIHALHQANGPTWGTELDPPEPYASASQSPSVAGCVGGTCSMPRNNGRYRVQWR